MNTAKPASNVVDAKPASKRAIWPANLTTPLWLLVAGAVGLLLYEAHMAFVPVALALLMALILSGPVEALHCLGVPRSVSAALILVTALGGIASVAGLMWTPAQKWYQNAPQTVQAVKQKLAPAARLMAHVEDMVGSASAMTKPATAKAPPVASTVAPAVEPTLLLDATRDAIVSILTFVIITLFLLAGGPPMLARMTAAFFDDLNAAHVLNIIEKVRAEVGRFYVTTALINVGLGLATAGAMTLCGMPTPYLWGLMAGVLNFIPYAGSATTLTVLSLVAVVTFDGVGRVLAVVGSYLVIATLEGQLVQPLFVGRRLEVNPLLIFLALWFGGLFWGIAGVILATPALVALKVVAENANGGESVLKFLGPNVDEPKKRIVGKIFEPMLAKLHR